MITPNLPPNPIQAALEAHRSQRKNSLDPSPHIVIVGPTGTGKSRSIKNLPPKETKIINLEEKILPFDNAVEFKEGMECGFSNSTQLDSLVKLLKDLPEKYIVIDSFTKYQAWAMIESRMMGGGYEIFNRYYKQLFDFFEALKKIKNKIIILLSMDEIVDVKQSSGAIKPGRYITCDGKWLTKVEGEFAIILFTEVKTKIENGLPKSEYVFRTNTDGSTSAKSPENMFPFEIPNDLKIVVEKVEKYFGLNQTQPTQSAK